MSSAEEAGESPLIAHLRARIEREGPLSVDTYMRVCLADPEHGYWQRQATIGAEGDFITAPEISQVFGELIGLWAAVVWRGMGAPAPLRLIELGPGRGTLLRDALRAVRSVPQFLAAASVHLIEASAPLRQAQRRTLASPRSWQPGQPPQRQPPAGPAANPVGASKQARDEAGNPAFVLPAIWRRADKSRNGDPVAIAWHEAISEVPEGPAIVIANEFLDALPIRQLMFADGAWHERVVDVDARGGLRFAVGPETNIATPTLEPVPGAIVELRAGEGELLAALARRASPLVGLFIDYGPIGPATGDTLQAVQGHAWVDPLSRPGRADLTAHVAFAGLADKARAAGLAADGPMTQALFLGRLGVAERAARLMAANPKEAGAIEAGVERLISPTGMGGLCKVLAVRSRNLPRLVPFV
jgi:NADH dehydrogenase [ubiquinone] 1 alpha subcomplex assembly factor 7